jgi:hypothetical protein
MALDWFAICLYGRIAGPAPRAIASELHIEPRSLSLTILTGPL